MFPKCISRKYYTICIICQKSHTGKQQRCHFSRMNYCSENKNVEFTQYWKWVYICLPTRMSHGWKGGVCGHKTPVKFECAMACSIGKFLKLKSMRVGGGGGVNISDSKYFTEISWDQRILFVKICKQSANQLAKVIVSCSKLVACCCFPKLCHCCGGILFARVQPKVLHRFMHPTSSTWHATSVS